MSSATEALKPMGADDFAVLGRAFDLLVDLPPAQRGPQLPRALVGRDDLRPALQRLLDATDAGAPALESTALELLERAASSPATASRDDDGDLSGQRAGDVQLLARIASGGMGDVYLGERAAGASRRRVAVKLLKRGLDTDVLLARFRREQHTLAALQHEGVVAFLDAGALPDGRPYLVMEHVDGAPITHWCRDTGASLAQRVALLVQACEAVQFAHQELVLHRDLKPDNILVTAGGRTQLLDFGVATLLSCDGDSTRPVTAGPAPLTWRYASPEQLRGERVSVATDVHALGLVLHELITGRPAFEGEPGGAGRGVGAGVGVGGHRQPPATPSSLLTGAQRRAVAGDLDAIVARATAADPDRRYPSVERLSDDLRRWLVGEPVSARQGRATERARRWASRHRLPVAAAAALLLLLGALLVGTWLGKRRAEDSASQGWGAHALARRATVFLEQVLVEGPPADAQARAALDVRVTEQLSTLPESEALVRLALGHLYLEQGHHADARRQLERALLVGERARGLNAPDTARALALLGRLAGPR